MERVQSFWRDYLPHARPFWPHAAAVLLIGFLGWANGFYQASRPVDNPNLKETWSVPAWTPYRAGPGKALFANLDIWDGAKKPTTTTVKQEAVQAWQFVGTVRTGKSFAAVILMGDTGRVRRATAGETLPNGEKIVDVENGLLHLDVDGTERQIKLFEQEKK